MEIDQEPIYQIEDKQSMKENLNDSMNDNSKDDQNQVVTSQTFDFLKKVSKIRTIYLRAFQKSMLAELDKDLLLRFKDDNEEMFKDIKQITIKYLTKYMDERYCDVVNGQDMQDRLLEYYHLDAKYENKNVKFALLSAEEENDLKSNAIEQLKTKQESMKDLINLTNQLKEEKCKELSAVFDEITENICKYDSIGAKEFDKDHLFGN